jgi:hypothetical protein
VIITGTAWLDPFVTWSWVVAAPLVQEVGSTGVGGVGVGLEEDEPHPAPSVARATMSAWTNATL